MGAEKVVLLLLHIGNLPVGVWIGAVEDLAHHLLLDTTGINGQLKCIFLPKRTLVREQS